MPCHQTIDYSDENWLEKWEAQETGKICAGALIMAANMCKRPRDPLFPRMSPDPAMVFTTSYEFMDYHEKALVRSWEKSNK